MSKPGPGGEIRLRDAMDAPLVWVGGDTASAKATLVAGYLAKRDIATTWYLGARLAAAALPELLRGLSAPETLILEGCEDLGPCSPVHKTLLEIVPAIPAGSKIILLGRGQPPDLYGPALADGRMAVLGGHQLQSALAAATQERRHFKVNVLGRFSLTESGVALGGSRKAQPKPIELLQALIAFGGTDVGAGKLIDALWADAEGDAGYHALETTLYRLRRLLGAPEAVQMANNRLSLDRQLFSVDLWEFELALQSLARPQGDIADRVAEAFRLYAGHFLEQEAEKPWALNVRQTIRDSFLRRIRTIARVYENQRRWEEAMSLYRSALDLDETAEDLHRGLMTCQRELGQHSEVLRTYHRCHERLLRSLGVSPDAKTQAIYRGVKQVAAARPSELRSGLAMLAGA